MLCVTNSINAEQTNQFQLRPESGRRSSPTLLARYLPSNPLVVPQCAKPLIRPRDDLLALFQTALDFDAILADDSDLDLSEDCPPVVKHENAFERLLTLWILL